MDALVMKVALGRIALLLALGATGCTSREPEPGSTRDAMVVEPRDDGGSRDAALRDAAEPAPADAARDAGELAIDAALPIADAGPELPGPWTDIVCDEHYRFVGELNPAVPVAYVGYYRRRTVEQDDEDGGASWVGRYHEGLVHGLPCSGAIDPLTCLEAIEALARNCDSERCDLLMIATAGDTVTVIEDPADLLELLGPIDTPAEAWVALFLERGSSCASPHPFDAGAVFAMREIDSGYEIEWNYLCVRNFITVRADATVHSERTEVPCL